MSEEVETCHNDWCELNGPCVEDENQCAVCLAAEKREAEYWAKRYYAEPRYSDDEIRDCYSEPSEYQKRERMLRWNQ